MEDLTQSLITQGSNRHRIYTLEQQVSTTNDIFLSSIFIVRASLILTYKINSYLLKLFEGS